MRLLKYYIILILPLLASSCGEYGKILKSTDNELKKNKALEYYAAGQYAKTAELLGQILPRYRATVEAEELNWVNAESSYKMKEYELAGTYYRSLVEEYPFGKHAEEATFKVAKCDYATSPRAELDQANSKKAIDGFNLFIKKYPASPFVEEARVLIKELEEKLVEKSYNSARLYYDMKKYKSAITALENSLKEYSESKYREEMMFLKLNSTYLYAVNSFANKQRERFQATLDDYYSFMDEYPETKYSKEIKRIYEVTADYLKIDTNKTTENISDK